jgi:hypothetical protein
MVGVPFDSAQGDTGLAQGDTFKFLNGKRPGLVEGRAVLSDAELVEAESKG